MDIPQIQTKLKELFLEHRIIFWNDVESEFEDSLNGLGLNGVELIRPDKIGQFNTKITLEIEHPEQKYLVYAAKATPDYEEDWLLDIRLYSYQFSATKASMLLDELGLMNYHLREYLNTRKKFFKSNARYTALKGLVNPEDTAAELDKKMLAVCVKSEQDDFFDIVRTIYNAIGDAESLDSVPDSWKQVIKLELEESFWGFVKISFGYEEDGPSLRHLLTSLLVTDLAYTLGDATPGSLQHFVLPQSNQSNVAVCLAQWRDSSSKGQSYDHLSLLVSEALGLEGLLTEIKLDTLLKASTFLDIEKIAASKLRDRVIQTSGAINAEEITQMAQKRQNKHWANLRLPDSLDVPRRALNAVYEAIVKAAEFFELKNTYSDGFDFNSSKEIYDTYCSKLYKFDQLYRLFGEYADISESQGWGLLKDLQEIIEDAYCNWYLESLAMKWESMIEPDSWRIDGIDNQYGFYDNNVKLVAGKGSSRGQVTGYVIISDAFRYEVAKELTRELNGKYRFTAELNSMLGVLPSYTSLGMASLLPHKKLEYDAKGTILVDGKPCSSFQHRSNILSAYGGIAIKAEELLSKKKDEGREFVRDKTVVYIYHNTIDAMGDSASTESKTFLAVRKAIEELGDLARYIVNNLNGSKIFITADHGFLFTDTKPDETDKHKLEYKPDSAIKSHKRFLIGKDLPQTEDTYSGKLATTAGMDTECHMSFTLPKGLSLFNFTGGARFIHGGMSLQETVIPVITVGRLRGKKAVGTRTRKVAVQVLSTNRRVTTNTHRFQLLQTDAVSERVKPVTLKVAIYDGDNPVTSIETITFDSSSSNMDDRTKWVTLALQNIDYGREKTYQLVLRDSETDIDMQRIDVKIDIAFTNDF